MSYVAAKLLVGVVLLALGFLPIWRRLFPWQLHVSYDELRGWRCWIDRIE